MKNSDKLLLTVSGRTLGQMKELGIIPEVKASDISKVSAYFEDIPDRLKVSPETPTGTIVLIAGQLAKNATDTTGVLLEHKPGSKTAIVTVDGQKRHLIYDSLALDVPGVKININREQIESLKSQSQILTHESVNQPEQSEQPIATDMTTDVTNSSNEESGSSMEPESNVNNQSSTAVGDEPEESTSKKRSHTTKSKVKSTGRKKLSSTITARKKSHTQHHSLKKGKSKTMAAKTKRLTPEEAKEKGLDLRKNDDRKKAGYPPITGRGRKPGQKNKPKAVLRQALGLPEKKAGHPAKAIQPVTMDGALNLLPLPDNTYIDMVTRKSYNLVEIEMA